MAGATQRDGETSVLLGNRHLYLIFIVPGIWVYVDARKRMNRRFAWAVGTAILGLIVLPIYYAKRNLEKGETRQGGTGSNIMKNFAIYWTVQLFLVAIIDTALGGTIALSRLGTVWFFPTIGSLIIGLIIKKPSVVEKGPTGEMANQ